MNPICETKTETTPSPAHAHPAADIYELPDKFLIRCDLPGVSREALEITADQGTLKVSGSAAAEPVQTPGCREWKSRNFTRVFRLGRDIDETAITANLRHGLLELTLPKRRTREPRRIEILS